MTNNKNSVNQNSSHSSDMDLQQRVQQLLAELQLDDAPAGGSIVVFQAGECIAQASIGMAQAEMPWQADTLSLNFSTGKGVLATLAHVLVSQRLLAYDSPIASYWPAFSANGKADITLRMLMSHQADLFAISAIDVDNATLLEWDKMLDLVAAMPATEPDNAVTYDSAYSALVYGWILGGLTEIVTGKSLAEALRYYLTQPLGIADSCYFGVPEQKVNNVSKLVKDFSADDSPDSQLRSKRHKPTLKADSTATLATYQQLASYPCWQQLATSQHSISTTVPLNATQINRLYFDHSSINANNYRAALVPASKQPIDYYDKDTMQAVIPAANGVASAQALATIYAMLANGGEWKGKVLIDSATFKQLSKPQVSGRDAVMPANMHWRLGYHRLFSICNDNVAQGFGHMGYNGSIAWCEPTRQLSFAFIHNFDVTMLNDIRQFALTESLLKLIDQKNAAKFSL